MNLTRTQLLGAVRQFARDAEGADAAIIYFAGHGVQLSGRNYVFPVDVGRDALARADQELVAVEILLESMRAAGGLRLLLLDACRDNPLNPSSGQSRVSEGGLADMSVQGALVLFAARPGRQALDGAGANSPFARALAARMGQAGVELPIVLGQVRDDVLRETAGWQEPSIYGEMPAHHRFLAPTSPDASIDRADTNIWELVQAAGGAQAREYLRLMRRGRHWDEALLLASDDVLTASASEFTGALHRVGGADGHRTIQGALDVAEDGDRIEIVSGVYRENLVIRRSVELIGQDVVIEGIDNWSSVVLVASGTSRLVGVRLRSTTNRFSLVSVDAGGVELRGVTFDVCELCVASIWVHRAEALLSGATVQCQSACLNVGRGGLVFAYESSFVRRPGSDSASTVSLDDYASVLLHGNHFEVGDQALVGGASYARVIFDQNVVRGSVRRTGGFYFEGIAMIRAAGNQFRSLTIDRLADDEITRQELMDDVELASGEK